MITYSVALPGDDGVVAPPVCLTCNLSADCQYVLPSFSPSARFYVRYCLGPGVPSTDLIDQERGVGEWSLLQVAAIDIYRIHLIYLSVVIFWSSTLLSIHPSPIYQFHPVFSHHSSYIDYPYFCPSTIIHLLVYHPSVYTPIIRMSLHHPSVQPSFILNSSSIYLSIHHHPSDLSIHHWSPTNPSSIVPFIMYPQFIRHPFLIDSSTSLNDKVCVEGGGGVWISSKWSGGADIHCISIHPYIHPSLWKYIPPSYSIFIIINPSIIPYSSHSYFPSIRKSSKPYLHLSFHQSITCLSCVVFICLILS